MRNTRLQTLSGIWLFLAVVPHQSKEHVGHDRQQQESKGFRRNRPAHTHFSSVVVGETRHLKARHLTMARRRDDLKFHDLSATSVDSLLEIRC